MQAIYLMLNVRLPDGTARVLAELLNEQDGVQPFLHRDVDGQRWTVSEFRTGIPIASATTKEEAILGASVALRSECTRAMISRALRRKGSVNETDILLDAMMRAAEK